jgi:PAS domain S-box-containing protein
VDFSGFDSIPIGICLIDRDFIVCSWNLCLRDWTGLSDAEVLDRDLRDIYPAFRRGIYTSRLEMLFSGGPPVVFSPRLHSGLFASPETARKKHVYHINVSPFLKEGESLALFAVQDISSEYQRSRELKQALEENRILLRELNHRTKNNYSMLLSLLELQKETLFDSRDEEIIDILISRIYSIQRVQEHLALQSDSLRILLGEYLRNLAGDILDSGSSLYSPDTHIEADAIELEPGKAIPLGMILAELITNSLKHAFTAIGGEIRIDAEEKNGMVTIRYQDSGPGRAGPPKNDGMGLRLNEAFAQQLGGSFRQLQGPGAPTVIDFPL